MKTIRTQDNHYEVFGEIYENVRELVDTVKARPHIFDRRDFLSESYVCDSPNHYGFKDGMSLVKDCLQSNVKTNALKAIQSGIKPVSHKIKINFSKNVAGFTPIVPLALINVPNSMRSQKRVAVKAKVVNLYVNISVACCHSETEISEAGQALMNYVIGLEQDGYRVGLTAFWGTCNYCSNSLAFIGLKLKDPSQPLDIKRCAYPFVNPSFHRGICFGWYQRTKDIHQQEGYGQVPREDSPYAPLLQSAMGTKNGVVVYFEDILRQGNSHITDALSKCADKGIVRA